MDLTVFTKIMEEILGPDGIMIIEIGNAQDYVSPEMYKEWVPSGDKQLINLYPSLQVGSVVCCLDEYEGKNIKLAPGDFVLFDSSMRIHKQRLDQLVDDMAIRHIEHIVAKIDLDPMVVVNKTKEDADKELDKVGALDAIQMNLLENEDEDEPDEPWLR